MKKIVSIFIILLLGFLLSCEKNAAKPTVDYLSGTWTEHVPNGKFYYEAKLHSFTFKQDSFTAKIISWTDIIVVFPGDPCPSNGIEEIYIKGKYSLSNDSIYFIGKLCDSLYQIVQPSCNGKSDFEIQYKFTKNDTAIIFNKDKQSSFGYGIILRKE